MIPAIIGVYSTVLLFKVLADFGRGLANKIEEERSARIAGDAGWVADAEIAACFTARMLMRFATARQVDAYLA
jgi:hypothetical protein